MSASLPLDIAAQLSQTRTVLEHHLSPTLQAIHLFGSAIDGGLKPHSDIDLMVTVSAPLAGIVEPATVDHDLAILLTKVRQHSICLVGLPAAELFEPVPQSDFAQALLATVAQWNQGPDWQGDERNVVLALARIWFSAATGGVAPKDVAATWALEHLPDEHRPILARAHAAYLGRAPDDLAECERAVAAFVRHTRRVIERLI